MNRHNSLGRIALLAVFSNVTPAYASNDPVQADPNTGASFNRYYYANNNPYKFVDPDGREVKLQWHEVMAGPIGTGKYHTLITVTPENQAPYQGLSAFDNKNSDGKSYSSLGAGPISGDLVAGVNRDSDRTPHSGGVVIPTPAQYKNEDQFIGALFQATANFSENTNTPEGAINYSFFPESNPGEYNSNSFVTGLLQSVGAAVPQLSNSPPGYKTPVPEKNYEKKRDENK